MKIAIGADHAGYEMKEKVKQHLEKQGIEVKDFGTHTSESVDYPEFGHPVADAVQTGKVNFGMVLCGSGNGINMTVNKHKGIRAALSWTPQIAELARQHNDANVLSLPSRYITDEEAFRIVDAFIQAEFEGGRHQRRVDKISPD